MTRLVGFGLGLWREPGKLRQAIALKRAMGRIVFRVGWWPVAAEGENRVEAVVLTNGARRERIGCDYLACGFGLAPNVELALALGCDLTSGFVAVDSAQRTSKPDVFAAGEITGIGGVDLSIIEGEIAGFAAVGDEAAVRERFAKRERARRFARGLERTFAIRDELKHTADPTTIVCRCEDVPHAALVDKTSWVDAKLQTRCGMGPCQGRICGAATAVLYGWSRASVRPPIFPTALGSLAGAGASHDARSSSS
jgi:NADPH-dependent 2,4-dienoyl-CoA reductase/sulfur reductase-like enzyme